MCKLTASLLPPQAGQVLVDGVDIREDYDGWLSHLGYIPQMIFMLDDTIRVNVAFGIPAKEVDDAQVWKALDNETEAAIMESINALHGRKTLVIIAHRLTMIEECDIVYRVDSGKIQLENQDGKK